MGATGGLCNPSANVGCHFSKPEAKQREIITQNTYLSVGSNIEAAVRGSTFLERNVCVYQRPILLTLHIIETEDAHSLCIFSDVVKCWLLSRML